MNKTDYLRLLAKEYPSIDATLAEIINLGAICCLPKGTEYFFSDIHGEFDAFEYLVGTASGVTRQKIESLFQNSVPEVERARLSGLIYRPKEVLAAQRSEASYMDWCRVTIYRLVQVCKMVSSKYTRSKVRKKMPEQFAYILDELLHADTEENKDAYYSAIINSIVDIEAAEKFIVSLCGLIRQCSIDQLHIIGDIFDRGPHADLVMEQLMTYRDVDIQWGNHDIHWMGAAAGNKACVANVVRLAISYNNFDLLEDAYGINLRPLSEFAADLYRDDPCAFFAPHDYDTNLYDPIDVQLAAKMHKAMAVIQFKLECQLLARHPEYHMADRAALKHVDFKAGTVCLYGKTWPLRDTLFPTVNPAHPEILTNAEAELIRTLTRSFTHSALLQKHIRFLYTHGGMYKIANGNVLYHGCIPMNEDGSFSQIELDGKTVSGQAYLDAIEDKIRAALYAPSGSAGRADAGDYLWYLWCGAESPLFGKNRLTTFERYFIEDPAAWQETRNAYYKHIRHREACERILHEFGLDPAAGAHIINGHVPVQLVKGEKPIKGGGLLFVIDGGISKAYHAQTGIGGYTLIYNSHHLALAEHRPFEEVRASDFQATPHVEIVELASKRITVNDTDIGHELQRRISELRELLAAYRSGRLRERM